MGRIEGSWRLVKMSWSVLKADKELLIFPIASFIALALVTASFAVPLWHTGFFEHLHQRSAGGYALLFLFYLVQYVIMTYANCALVGAALIRLRGNDPTVRDGLQAANQHLGAILGYALIAGSVGMLLRVISERVGLVGKIIVGLIGIVWSVATFLAVPVLVSENVGPAEAIQRSAGLLKKTWGEQVIGSFSIGLIFFLISLPVIFIGIALCVAAAAAGLAAVVLVASIVVIALLGLSMISSAMSSIYQPAASSPSRSSCARRPATPGRPRPRSP